MNRTESRKKALKWWNSLSTETKSLYVVTHGEEKVIGYRTRELSSITGREIELLWDYNNLVNLTSNKLKV